MKRILAIVQILLFALYVFTFKTHYCYYSTPHENVHQWYDHDGNLQYCESHDINDRYHGNCHWWMDNAENMGLANKNLFPSEYYCLDITKTDFSKTKITAPPKPLSNHAAILSQSEILFSETISYYKPQRNVHCRAGPSLLITVIRGPPLT